MDLHLRYTLAILDLLAPGRALTRRPGTNTYQLAEGLADELARIHARNDDAVREMIPWRAVELLPDWEALLGITAPAALLEERQAAVRARLQGDGPPTKPGFEAIAESLDYAITWHRDAPFVCGVSRVGARAGGERRIFTWEAYYQVGGSNDALLEQLLTDYGGGHGGGQLTPEATDWEATFRGDGGDLVTSGSDVIGWTNVGDVDPLPSGFTAGTGSTGTVHGQPAADFDGLGSLVTADAWTEYASPAAKYVVVVVEVDAAGVPKSIVSGGFGWVLGVGDFGAGPALAAFSDDGGSGIYTPSIPITLGTTYVAELLHHRGWLQLRVFDALGHRSESIPAPPTASLSGSLGVGAFDGRIAHIEVYGARDAIPPRADRDALAVGLALQYTDAGP